MENLIEVEIQTAPVITASLSSPTYQGAPGQNGKDGAPGKSGVYIGIEEPTDPDIMVWINPEDDSVEEFATIEYVQSEITRIMTGGEIDLSNYATKSYVDDAIAEIPSQDLSSYAKKTDLPKRTSQLTNDSGFLTKHQSLEGLATESFVQNKIDAIPSVDLSDYAKKRDIPNLEGLATEQFVTDKIAEAELGGGDTADLSAYAKTADLEKVAFSGDYNDLKNQPTIPEGYDDTAIKNRVLALENKEDKDTVYNDSEIRQLIANKQDKGDYLTAVPAEYITETDLENKGFLTEHQSLSDYYTKQEANSLLSKIPKFSILVVDVLPDAGDNGTVYLVPSKRQGADNMYAEYIYVDGFWEQLGVQEFDLTGYATQNWVSNQGYLTNHQSLTAYATKTWADQQYVKKANISNWALAASKPTYTAEEVGALPDSTVIPTNNSQLENGAGYITAEALSSYQTAEQVQAAITSALGSIGVAEEGVY